MSTKELHWHGFAAHFVSETPQVLNDEYRKHSYIQFVHRSTRRVDNVDWALTPAFGTVSFSFRTRLCVAQLPVCCSFSSSVVLAALDVTQFKMHNIDSSTIGQQELDEAKTALRKGDAATLNIYLTSFATDPSTPDSIYLG